MCSGLPIPVMSLFSPVILHSFHTRCRTRERRERGQRAAYQAYQGSECYLSQTLDLRQAASDRKAVNITDTVVCIDTTTRTCDNTVSDSEQIASILLTSEHR